MAFRSIRQGVGVWPALRLGVCRIGNAGSDVCRLNSNGFVSGGSFTATSPTSTAGYVPAFPFSFLAIALPLIGCESVIASLGQRELGAARRGVVAGLSPLLKRWGRNGLVREATSLQCATVQPRSGLAAQPVGQDCAKNARGAPSPAGLLARLTMAMCPFQRARLEKVCHDGEREIRNSVLLYFA